MKKMASSHYDFQGPYVLGSQAGFPLGPWLQWTTGQASVGEPAPSLLHTEAELHEGRGKNKVLIPEEVTSGRSPDSLSSIQSPSPALFPQPMFTGLG